MQIDQDLYNVFYEEVHELSTQLESSLMDLENNQEDKELINKIFRILHTIKGSCGLVGFNKISDFIHKIETVYQSIRDGKFSVKKELINYSLEVNDYIIKLVDNLESVSDEDINELLVKIYSLYDLKLETDSKHDKKEDKLSSTLASQNSCEIEAQGKTKFFKIDITPNEDLFIRGVDIVEILDAFKKIGDIVYWCNNEKVPDLLSLNPELSYFFWEIFVKTQKDINDIKKILLFLERGEFKIYEISEPEKFGEQLELLRDSRKKLSKEKTFESKKVKEVTKKTKAEKIFAADFHKDAYLKISQHKLDILLDLVGELVINQSILSLLSDKYNIPQLLEVNENFERLITELRDVTLDLRMVQIGNFLNRFKRIVRDIANEEGKKADILIEGGETEVDKSVIDIMINPLTHILRNSIDHGIETPEERLEKNKPETGQIKIIAKHTGGYISISIHDDGKGIDPESVKQKAVSLGLVSEDSALSDKDIIDFIFYPGLSTSEKVSDVSGRGVGMDVVKKEIKKIGGDISIKSVKDKGTEINITLPLTLAIIEGIMVQVEKEFYVIPNEFVKHCVEYFPDRDFEESRGKLIKFREHLIPFIRLKEYFNCSSDISNVEEIVLVDFSGNLFGLVVDKIIGNKQIVIKNFGPILNKLNCFSGATINGDGSIALILDIVALFNDLKSKLSL